MSGRASSTNDALAMNTLPLRGSGGVLAKGVVVSPGCRSRHSSTRCTPILSSVQPVTATDPASTVESPAGVSKLPNGSDAGAVDGTVLSVTLIGPAVLDAPVKARLMRPVCDAASPDTN